jgi:hypothetical protein
MKRGNRKREKVKEKEIKKKYKMKIEVQRVQQMHTGKKKAKACINNKNIVVLWGGGGYIENSR